MKCCCGITSGCSRRTYGRGLDQRTLITSSRRFAAEPQAVRWLDSRPELAVNVSAIAYLDDHDDQLSVHDFIQDPIVPLAEAVFLLPTKLFAAGGPRVGAEGVNAVNDAPPVFERDALQLFGRRPLDANAIVCHAASCRG